MNKEQAIVLGIATAALAGAVWQESVEGKKKQFIIEATRPRQPRPPPKKKLRETEQAVIPGMLPPPPEGVRTLEEMAE